ncbi:hypothetical protein ACIGHN_27580 [Acidovorax sp. NPDC077693]|uniref:hypothetical protein n=1 Tax=unclassified Acidovorax TaxID=2684926 RepID=UPI0037C72F7B
MDRSAVRIEIVRRANSPFADRKEASADEEPMHVVGIEVPPDGVSAQRSFSDGSTPERFILNGFSSKLPQAPEMTSIKGMKGVSKRAHFGGVT